MQVLEIGQQFNNQKKKKQVAVEFAKHIICIKKIKQRKDIVNSKSTKYKLLLNWSTYPTDSTAGQAQISVLKMN